MRMWALGPERPPLSFPIYTTGDQYPLSIITTGGFKNTAPEQAGRGLAQGSYWERLPHELSGEEGSMLSRAQSSLS